MSATPEHADKRTANGAEPSAPTVRSVEAASWTTLNATMTAQERRRALRLVTETMA